MLILYLIIPLFLYLHLKTSKVIDWSSKPIFIFSCLSFLGYILSNLDFQQINYFFFYYIIWSVILKSFMAP